MPRNGSGTFNFITNTAYPAVNGVTLLSADWNTFQADVGAALTGSVASDGQTTMTGNLKLGNNRATSMAAAAAITDGANANDVQSGRLVFLTGVAGTNTITASLTGFTAYAAGNGFRFVAAGTNTGATTLNINAVGAKSITKSGLSPLVAGDIVSGGTYEVVYDGTQFQLVTDTRPPKGYISGLTLSTAGSSTTFSVAAGECADSTDTVMMQLAASLSKTTSSWAVGSGNGGLDTGAIAINTWYHAYVIRRPDTGVVDSIVSLSPSAPTLPTNYTQYRRIGAMRTNASSQWTSFVQDGDLFQWLAPVLDVNGAIPGSSAVLRALSVPTGLNVTAIINCRVVAGPSGEGIYFSDPAVTNLAASGTVAPLSQVGASANVDGYGQVTCRTDTSAQVRTRLAVGGTSAFYAATCGWYDTRGA